MIIHKKRMKEMYKILLEDGSDLLVSEKHRVYAKEKERGSLISLVMMTKEDESNNLIYFINGEFKDKAFEYVDSSFASQIIPHRLIMSRIQDDLTYLVFNGFSQDRVLFAGFFNLSFTGWNKRELKVHFNDLKNSSAEEYFLPGTSFNLLFNSSTCSFLGGSSSTGCQSICSQNSQSSSDISLVCSYLLNMSRFINLTTDFANNLESNLNSSLGLINSGILTSIDKSGNDYLNVVKNSVSDFSLMPVIDVYSSVNEGKEAYFLNALNEPVKIKSITKEEQESDKKMYKILLEDGSDLLVSEKHRVYAKEKEGNDLISPVMMRELIENQSSSFNLEHQDKTSDMDSFVLAEVSPKILEMLDSTRIQSGDLVNLILGSSKQGRILSLELLQDILNSSSINIHTESHHLLNSSKLMGFFLPDLSSLAVCSIDLTTSLTTDSLTSLVSSSDISEISCIFFFNRSSLISFNVSAKARLATADQLIKSVLSISSFSSFGTDNVIVPILGLQSDYLYYVYIKDIFKSFGFEGLELEDEISEFSLMPITDAYSSLNDGKEAYFLNAFNKPVKVKSITKDDGKVYDINVENDIVLMSNEDLANSQYNNKGVSFSVSVVGSTSNPNDCKTTTPSKTLSTKSEIQTGKASSLPFNLIHALPLSIFTVPAPVLTFSSPTALIFSSSANFLGRTVKLAPVLTNALTTFECFFSKSLISISTDMCPIVDSNRTEYLNLSESKLTMNKIEEAAGKQVFPGLKKTSFFEVNQK